MKGFKRRGRKGGAEGAEEGLFATSAPSLRSLRLKKRQNPMPFSSDVLTIERDGPVATLWLDSPERRNAMGPAFWADLPRAMHALSDDAAVRAVVLAARGPSFTVGLDLKTMGPLLLQHAQDGSDAQ